MNPISRRLVLSLAASTVALGATGCWGSFGATNKLWKFNDGISDSKWIKWLLFLGLIILPVYSLFILGDALIFNTIEFFTDKNPLSGATRDFGNGNTVAFERDKHDPELVRIEHRHNGKLVGTFYVKKSGDHFRLLDEQRKLVAETRDENGAVTLLDQQGRVLVRLDADDMRKVSMRTKEMGSPERALGEALDDRTVLVAGRIAPQAL
jgi:Domain of unknown function (DUF3332)